MNITANNIVLNCQGHMIDGVNASDTYGIYISSSNISVKNCTITDWNNGIYLESNNNFLSNIILNSNFRGISSINSNYNNLTDITISHSDTEGIYFENSNNNNLTNVVVEYSGYYPALNIYFSNNNTIENVTLRFNYVGVQLFSSNYSTFKNSKIIGNNYYGFYITGSTKNQIYNNLFNNSNNFNFGGDIYTNYWNTTLQTGNNIWNTSLGYIGGNYWTNPDGNGYSDTCHDTNADGFCDDPYILATDNIDYLPIAKTVGQGAIPTPTCVEPYENMVINNDTILCSGSYYLNDSDRNGAIIINGNNFTIICNNTEIYGDYNTNWEQGIGFRIDAKNVTIIGCKLRDYANPIELFNTEDVILKEINITHYGVRGIWGLNNTRLIIRDSYFSDHWDNWGASIDLSGGEEDGNYPCEKINSFDLIYNNTFKDMTLSTRFGECVYNLTIDNNYFENIYVSIIGDLGLYKLKETSSINITNNTIKSNWFGIIISGPDNINIFGNYILGEIGVYAENSNNITIEDSKLIQKIPQIEEIGYLIYFVNISGSNVKGSLMKNGNISISNGANIEISNSTLEFINGNYYSYLNLTDSKIYNNTFYVVNENYSSTVSSYFYLNSTNFEFFDNVIYTNKSTNNAIFSTLIRYSAYNSSFYNNYGYGEYPNAVIIGSISYSSSNAEKIYVYNNYIESTGSYCIQSTKGSEHYIYNNRIDDGCIMVLGPVSNTYIHDNNISYFGIVGVNNEINNMIAYNNTLRADSSDYPNKKIWYGDIDIGTKLYGNNIYHPETTTLDPYLSITLNYTEIDYGLVMPYNYYNYIGGITIDTNRIDYKIEVNSTDLVNGTNVIDKSNFSFGFSKTTDFNFLIKPYNTITILKQLLQDSYNILTRLYIPLVYPLRYEGVINITASLGLSENQIL
jgi:parallel beta-helix repeat protein